MSVARVLVKNAFLKINTFIIVEELQKKLDKPDTRMIQDCASTSGGWLI